VRLEKAALLKAPLLPGMAANSLHTVKVFLAVLLLSLQLQPVFGTMACLSIGSRAQQAECEMPEHGAVPHSTVAQTESATPSCALASVCAPSQLAIAGLSDIIQSVTDFRTEPSVTAANTLFSISSSPPFHPPRA
jgi:hypothetical protein